MEPSNLIVDDATFMRNLFREMVKANFRIQGEAKNVVEAVDLCRELEPEFELTDVEMPNRDGIDATHHTRDEELGATVIMGGTVGQETEIKQALNAGTEGYITKPFQKSIVFATIEAFESG